MVTSQLSSLLLEAKRVNEIWALINENRLNNQNVKKQEKKGFLLVVIQINHCRNKLDGKSKICMPKKDEFKLKLN